tara:strand:+ start:15 stop:194 length:180 start_codon:yes stop_codon:yes gene_type:complete
MKYFKTQGELIDHYVSYPNHLIAEALIHAYELGAMHHSEDTNFELAEFDSNYEKETNNG